MQGIVSQNFPYPEGRPSTFWGITGSFEALFFDFEIICNIREEQNKASSPPTTASEAFRRKARDLPPHMRDKVKERIERQRQKRKKREDAIVLVNHNES